MPSYFSTYQLTRAGGRPYNEDSLGQAEVGDVCCWVVADGLGGHEGGATASKLACDAAIASFRANPALTSEALNGHIQSGDEAVRREQVRQPGLARMRTTIVVLVANSTHAIWGHAGDSRLYRISAGRIADQTKDHSVPQSLVEAGEISPQQIRHHEDRSRLLRVLGEEGGNRATVVPQPVALSAGDAFLLCSDGFWENVCENEMELDFAKSRQPAEWLGYMETRLQERVNGSHDNYTAIAVFGDSLPCPRPPMPPIHNEPLRASIAAPPTAETKPSRLLSIAVLLFVPVLALLLFVSFWAPAHQYVVKFLGRVK